MQLGWPKVVLAMVGLEERIVISLKNPNPVLIELKLGATSYCCMILGICRDALLIWLNIGSSSTSEHFNPC